MRSFISDFDYIRSVAMELNTSDDDLSQMNGDEQNVLAEIIYVLAEFRRVARQLKADCDVTMSRTTRLLHELHDTLLVMKGDMTHAKESHYATDDCHQTLDTSSANHNAPRARTFPSIQSTAQHCLDSNKALKIQI